MVKKKQVLKKALCVTLSAAVALTGGSFIPAGITKDVKVSAEEVGNGKNLIHNGGFDEFGVRYVDDKNDLSIRPGDMNVFGWYRGNRNTTETDFELIGDDRFVRVTSKTVTGSAVLAENVTYAYNQEHIGSDPIKFDKDTYYAFSAKVKYDADTGYNGDNVKVKIGIKIRKNDGNYVELADNLIEYYEGAKTVELLKENTDWHKIKGRFMVTEEIANAQEVHFEVIGEKTESEEGDNKNFSFLADNISLIKAGKQENLIMNPSFDDEKGYWYVNPEKDSNNNNIDTGLHFQENENADSHEGNYVKVTGNGSAELCQNVSPYMEEINGIKENIKNNEIYNFNFWINHDPDVNIKVGLLIDRGESVSGSERWPDVTEDWKLTLSNNQTRSSNSNGWYNIGGSFTTDDISFQDFHFIIRGENETGGKVAFSVDNVILTDGGPAPKEPETQKPSGAPEPTGTNNPSSGNSSYIPGPSGTNTPTPTPTPSATPVVTNAPASSNIPYITATPTPSNLPDVTGTPAPSNTPGNTCTCTPVPSNAPGVTTEVKTDDVTGAVTETTTQTNCNKTTVTEKVTMPDGTVSTKETVTENKDGLKVVTETLTSTSTSVTLVKVIEYDINGTIVNAYAEIHTGLSDTDSESSADTIVPENYFQNIKSSGIYIVDIYIEKITVDIAREKLSPETLVKIVLPDPDGVVIRKVIVRKGSIKSAKEGGKNLVASLQCQNLSNSYTVTIPKSELKKINKEMKKDTNILVKTGKVSVKKINKILSSNKIGKNGSYTVKIADNNTKGGIKVATPVMIPSAKTGNKVYAYYYNKKTGKLEEIANNKVAVTKEGEAAIEGFSGNTYVITKKELKGNKVVTLLNRARASIARSSIKAGKRTRVRLNLGKGLVLKRSLKSSTPYAKQAAVVTYKSSAPKTARVFKNGTISAKRKGKAQITVRIRLAGGKVKTIKRNIVVK